MSTRYAWRVERFIVQERYVERGATPGTNNVVLCSKDAERTGQVYALIHKSDVVNVSLISDHILRS